MRHRASALLCNPYKFKHLALYAQFCSSLGKMRHRQPLRQPCKVYGAFAGGGGPYFLSHLWKNTPNMRQKESAPLCNSCKPKRLERYAQFCSSLARCVTTGAGPRPGAALASPRNPLTYLGTRLRRIPQIAQAAPAPQPVGRPSSRCACQERILMRRRPPRGFPPETLHQVFRLKLRSASGAAGPKGKGCPPSGSGSALPSRIGQAHGA